MSGLYCLVSGTLARDPERRTGSKGEFATATIRVGSGDAVMWIGIVAFADSAERLLQLRKGAPIAASGRAELKEWTGRDGSARHGISIVVAEIAANKPQPRRRSAPQHRHAHRPVAVSSGNGRPFDDGLPSW